MVLSASICRKNLFRNIKDEIILEVFKINHRKAYEKKNIGDLEVMRKLSGKNTKTVCSIKEIFCNKASEKGNIFIKKIVKKVMIKAGIPPSINEETVCRVL